MRARYDDGGPDLTEGPCDLCGLFEDDCICPECPVCEAHGDKLCYQSHGLVMTEAQIDSRKRMEATWNAEADAERVALDQWAREEKSFLDNLGSQLFEDETQVPYCDV